MNQDLWLLKLIKCMDLFNSYIVTTPYIYCPFTFIVGSVARIWQGLMFSNFSSLRLFCDSDLRTRTTDPGEQQILAKYFANKAKKSQALKIHPNTPQCRKCQQCWPWQMYCSKLQSGASKADVLLLTRQESRTRVVALRCSGIAALPWRLTAPGTFLLSPSYSPLPS